MTPRARLAALLAGAVTASALVLVAPAEAAVSNDGSSPSRAAASCWEVKQNGPDAPDGVYWLVTPRLQAPTRFYCDQTTDGGGWVLIGRGRQQWVEGGDGWGTTADVSDTVTGTAAMRAKQLSNHVVDGLLDGGRVDRLDDGIRLKRAANRTGTSWQEVRLKLKTRDRWTWALSGGLALSSYRVGSSATTKSQTTRNMTLKTDTQRTWTGLSAYNGWAAGFSYGKKGPKGGDDPASYLYSTVAGGAYASPFTQMYLRPKLTSASRSFTRVPDAGTPAQAAPAIPESGAVPSPWGVAGLGKGGTLDYATEVSAFAQVGSRVYVGGNFTTVRNSAGTVSHKQAYLAAFDAGTGEWISGFRPTLDNQVKAIEALPGGRLAVGGQFTRVNGKTATSLVVLDPATGATDPAFKASFAQSTKGAHRWVRALDVSGPWLYVGGGFSSYKGGTAKKATTVRNIVRVKASDGTPDTSWLPNLGTGLPENGKAGVRSSVLALDVSDDASRVYAAGQFQQAYVGADGKAAVAMKGLAAITTGTKATFQSWPVTWSSTKSKSRYQQAVEQVGSRVWTGGSQHNLFSYSTSTLKRSTANMTLNGGDIQAITARKGIVYASCHCYEWNYSGMSKLSTSNSRTPTSHTQVDRIGSVGAWDASTGAYVPAFAPTVGTRRGEGPWALLSATDGTLWAGGDYTSVVGRSGKNQWTGGFARFALRPHTPPAAPSGLEVALSGSTARLTWNASSTSGVSYEVLRNDRVVVVTDPGDRSVAVPDSTKGDRWFVRASDGRGNRSASTSVATPGPTPPDPTTLVDSGDHWAYWFDRDVPVDDRWKSATWEPGDTWPYGASSLGWGPNANHSIDTPTTGERALTTYFRRRFTADPADFSTVTITTRADDGAVVHLNGTEIGRRNMPSGPVTPTTYATDGPAVRDWTITVPASVLRTGNKANTIAVEVHLNHRAAAGMSHDAVVTAR